MRLIGMIGGMSWTSSLEYYRQLNRETQKRLGSMHSARVLMWSVDFAEHKQIHDRLGWDGVAEEMVEIAQKLKNSGAEFLIMAVNTVHRVAPEVEHRVGLPILHIADAVGASIRKTGMRRVGLLGTRFTMEEEFYHRRLSDGYGLEVILPDKPDREAIDRIIFEELVAERYQEASREKCLAVIDRLADSGAEGVILGCTELPLLIDPAQGAVPLFDTVAIHARAAVVKALS